MHVVGKKKHVDFWLYEDFDPKHAIIDVEVVEL